METLLNTKKNMKFNKLKTLASALIAALAFASSANAIIVSSNGGSIISAPASTAKGANEANYQQGFNEKQGVVLTDDLDVDGGHIEEGTKVNSHMIFLDSIGSQDVLQTVKWVFDGMIIGVMSDRYGNLEAASNGLLGASNYPGSFRGRGFEGGGDNYVINGNELNLTMHVTQPGDWIRVVTRVPDSGSTMALLGLGFLGLIATRKRFAR